MRGAADAGEVGATVGVEVGGDAGTGGEGPVEDRGCDPVAGFGLIAGIAECEIAFTGAVDDFLGAITVEVDGEHGVAFVELVFENGALPGRA